VAFMGASDGVHFTISATDMASRTIRGVGNSFLYLGRMASRADNRMHRFFWRGTDDVKMWARVIILSLPLVGGLLATTANAAAGLVSALVSMGPGIGAFAATVIGNFDAIKKSAAFKELKAEWKEFLVDTKPTALEAANSALGTLSDLLPRLTPMVKAFGGVFTKWMDDVRESMKGKEFQGFLDWVKTVGALNFENTLNALENLTVGIGNLSMAFSDSGTGVTQWLEDVTGKFRDWTASLRDGTNPALDRFFAFIRQQWPPIREMLVAFARAISNIVVAMAPLGPHLAQGLTAIFNAIAGADPDHIRAVALALLAFRGVNLALIATTSALGGLSAALGGFKKSSRGVDDAGHRNERGFMATSRGAGVMKVGVLGAVAAVIASFDQWMRKDAELKASWERLKAAAGQLRASLEANLGPAIRSILTATFNAIATGSDKAANALPAIRQVMLTTVTGTLAALQLLMQGFERLFSFVATTAARLAPFSPAAAGVAQAASGAAEKARALAAAIGALKSKAITVTTTFIRRDITYKSTVVRDPVKGDAYGYAVGGRPPVGRASLVGERGPELFVPDRPGTVLPADVTARLLQDGDTAPAPNAGPNMQDLLDAYYAMLRELAAIRAMVGELPRNIAHQKRLAGATS
jgi:hypothetical protein